MADFDAALNNRLPNPAVTDGAANAPAARSCTVWQASHPNLHHLAPQVIDLHDPCVPVIVRKAQDE